MERDKSTIFISLSGVNFNSHAHVERDRSADFVIYCIWIISTHTLTWSVTGFKNKAVELEHFNSHAHVERDNEPYKIMVKDYHFNSHAHVERD